MKDNISPFILAISAVLFMIIVWRLIQAGVSLI